MPLLHVGQPTQVPKTGVFLQVSVNSADSKHKEPFQAVETESQKTNYRLQHLRNQAFRMIVAGTLQVYELCARNAPGNVLSVPARKYRIIASSATAAAMMTQRYAVQ
jgi:spore coat polysaccharide biosynthesis predicted glycosyltransferase SpsG